MLKTINASRAKLGRLIGTTDSRLAPQLGRLITLSRIAGDVKIKYEATEEGSLCYYIRGEVYEIIPKKA